LSDRLGVKRGNDRKVIATGVGALRDGRIEAEIGRSDDEVDCGNFTGGWIDSCADILGSEDSGIRVLEYG
jgi:hypothetical protein